MLTAAYNPVRNYLGQNGFFLDKKVKWTCDEPKSTALRYSGAWRLLRLVLINAFNASLSKWVLPEYILTYLSTKTACTEGL